MGDCSSSRRAKSIEAILFKELISEVRIMSLRVYYKLIYEFDVVTRKQ